MQFFWLYVDDFVGKGLSLNVIARFIWYQSAVLVTLALPLAVLLSSLMTFGNLGESFELVKSGDEFSIKPAQVVGEDWGQ